MRSRVAFVHDYLTQRGGAERVVLSMLKGFPDAPLFTSLYAPARTFPEFREVDVRPMRLNRIPILRRDHRLALPVLAKAFSKLEVGADVVVCSSSGWAHASGVRGRKIVYCHSPARWLYQSETYLGSGAVLQRGALKLLSNRLRAWDQSAAQSADRYLTNSRAVRERIRTLYDIEAEILPPPYGVDPSAPRESIEGIEPGFVLCICRLLPYKNVDAVLRAFAGLPETQLVVIGTGPDLGRLRKLAPPNAVFLGSVADARLRWLYANATAVVAASYEDYGLTPLEAAAFGKPAAVLRFGGFLDTVREGLTGLFFDHAEPDAIRVAIQSVLDRSWDRDALEQHADGYSERRFLESFQEIVASEAGSAVNGS